VLGGGGGGGGGVCVLFVFSPPPPPPPPPRSRAAIAAERYADSSSAIRWSHRCIISMNPPASAGSNSVPARSWM